MDLKLPKSLTACREALEKALRVAVLGEWPLVAPEKDSPFEDAPQPQAIAQALLWELHPHLTGARIAYVFKKEMAGKGKVKLGTAKKASAELTHFAEYDFVLSFNWTYWRDLTALQRIALVDHELMHCGRNDAGTGYTMIPHDVEEFGAIVRRYGLWKPDLEQFARAIGTEQLSLLALLPEGANDSKPTLTIGKHSSKRDAARLRDAAGVGARDE